MGKSKKKAMHRQKEEQQAKKVMMTMGVIAIVLAVSYTHLNRLMEEALWGMDYVMKTRLGDGYRAQTWGTNLWTDGKVGTDDDEMCIRDRLQSR